MKKLKVYQLINKHWKLHFNIELSALVHKGNKWKVLFLKAKRRIFFKKRQTCFLEGKKIKATQHFTVCLLYVTFIQKVFVVYNILKGLFFLTIITNIIHCTVIIEKKVLNKKKYKAKNSRIKLESVFLACCWENNNDFVWQTDSIQTFTSKEIEFSFDRWMWKDSFFFPYILKEFHFRNTGCLRQQFCNVECL